MLVNDRKPSEISRCRKAASLAQQRRAEDRPIDDVHQPRRVESGPIAIAPVHGDVGCQVVGARDARAVMEDQVDARVLLAEAPQPGDQPAGAEDRPDGERHRLARPRGMGLDRGPDIAEGAADDARQRASGVGEDHGARLAHEERATPVPLKLADVVADRCRADMKLLGSILETHSARGGLERAELGERHLVTGVHGDRAASWHQIALSMGRNLSICQLAARRPTLYSRANREHERWPKSIPSGPTSAPAAAGVPGETPVQARRAA